MSKRLLLALAVCTAVASLSAGSALAGEVKGPPNQVNNTDRTGAPSHANSECAFSGLNDFEPFGQNASQVQTAADSWKYYDLPKGTPGEACNGHLNPLK